MREQLLAHVAQAQQWQQQAAQREGEAQALRAKLAASGTNVALLRLAMQMQHAMRRLQSYAETTAELPVCFSHGDYTYTQLIFDENTCGLVDFDTVCQAEPALDLGQFLAYMRLAARKAEDGILAKGGEPIALDVDALSEQFVEMYIHTAELGSKDAEQLRARVAAYEIISLMRITLHSWQKMKSSRLEVAAALLEERVTALPIVK